MRGRISVIIILLTLLFYSHSINAQTQTYYWRVDEIDSGEQINDIWAPTPSLITIVTNQGNAMHSTDGGQTWHHNQTIPNVSLNAITGWSDPFTGVHSAITVGDNGQKWKTTDGGQSWVRDDFQTTSNMNDITSVPDPAQQGNNHLWSVGDNSTIFHSTNNGAGWTQQTTQYQSENFYCTYFYNQYYGYIGGEYYILYGTTNGGAGWNYIYNAPMYSGPNYPTYYGSYFASSTHGWLVGSYGTIANTTNGGSSWYSQTSGTSQQLNDVHFLDNLNGMAVGHGGTMLSTTDGGNTWAPVTTSYTGDFKCITADNEGNYWAAGENGAVVTNAPETQSTFSLGRNQVNIAVSPANNGPVNTMPGQEVLIDVNPSEGTTLDWSVNYTEDWLVATPNHGSNTGFFKVGVSSPAMDPGTYQATVTVTDINNPEQTQTLTVNLDVLDGANTSPPFGTFDTPLNGATVRSSVPVTGWALDDTGVESVKIYRSGSEGQVYIGDAVMVEGARPDVQTSYPDYPNNHKAGWGYMMLTNFLPNGGNGTYTIYAEATDYEGQTTSLGSKTIVCDNANAVKPFGAIDTPQPGGTASGSSYRNWGWALTPPPNSLSPCGSSIDVYIDGTKVGNPVYNNYRSDIASLFPDYANSNGAVGYFDFNTTQYANGVHTIQWTATDNAGNTDGIGSRFFTISNADRPIMDDELGSGTPFIILNSDGPIISTVTTKLAFGASAGSINIPGTKFDFTTNTMIAGTPHTQLLQIENTGGSPLNWEASTNQDWISFDPAAGTVPSWLAVIVDPSGMAAGEYTGYVTISDADEACPPFNVKVVMNVTAQSESPIGEFNFPDMDRVVSGTINITGWALDDIGVKEVNVYQGTGDARNLIGEASFVRDGRPDIAHAYSHYPFNNYACWQLSYITNQLDDGEYYFEAEAIDYEGNATILEGFTFTIDNANSVTPFGDVDAPAAGEIISGDSYQISGWALTPLPNTIPTDGSTINIIIDGVNVGSPIYNMYRSEIAALFPANNNSNGSGGIFDFNTTEYSDGTHTIAWSVTDDDGNVNGSLGAHEFIIQNNSNITVDVDEGELEIPKETLLMQAYPNPFNPSTTIGFKLSQDEKVNITVFDILGRKVVTLINDEFKSAGSYNIYWNGRNENGLRLTSGVYLVVMNAGSYMKAQKIMLLK